LERTRKEKKLDWLRKPTTARKMNDLSFMEPPEPDATLKFLVIGNEGVGKTSLITKYCNEPGWVYTTQSNSTSPIQSPSLSSHTTTTTTTTTTSLSQPSNLGNQQRNATIRSRTEVVDNKLLKIELWDAASTLSAKELFGGVKGILLCFDLTNSKSFNELDSWLRHVGKKKNERKMREK